MFSAAPANKAPNPRLLLPLTRSKHSMTPPQQARFWRKELLALPLEAVANSIGVPISVLSRYETGVGRLSLDKIFQLETLLRRAIVERSKLIAREAARR